MSTATGTVQLYRVRFWRENPILLRHFARRQHVINLQDYSNFENLDARLWRFENLPTWITHDDNVLRADPPHAATGTFAITLIYDGKYRNTLRFTLQDVDLIWTDSRGIAWTDASGIAWGEKR